MVAAIDPVSQKRAEFFCYEEPYKKITVIMYERQILHMDKVALAIRDLFPVLNK